MAATDVSRVVSIDVGSTNMGVCVIERSSVSPEPSASASAAVEEYPYRILHWELIDLQGSSTNNAIRNLPREFLLRPVLYDGVTDVVVESQDVAQPTIQRIGAAIHSHYATWSMMNVGGRRLRVHVVSGKNKFKAHNGDLELPARFPAKGSYRYNKRLSEEMARDILKKQKDNERLEWFNKCPKKDDLSDAFLQGIWALKNPSVLKLNPPIHPPIPHT